MNQWITFATENPKIGNTNESIAGGKFVGLGKHLLKIDGIEQALTKYGAPYYKITYINKDGQTLMDRLYPLYTNSEGKQQQSFKYKNLAHALIPEDGTLRFEFFTDHGGILPNNPALMAGLVGLFVEAKVVKGSTGYTIEDDNGVYRLYDSKNKEFYVLDGGIPNEFESYKEARDAAKAQGLFRAWHEIGEFTSSPSHVEVNHQIITKLKESVTQVHI